MTGKSLNNMSDIGEKTGELLNLEAIEAKNRKEIIKDITKAIEQILVKNDITVGELEQIFQSFANLNNTVVQNLKVSFLIDNLNNN